MKPGDIASGLEKKKKGGGGRCLTQVLEGGKGKTTPYKSSFSGKKGEEGREIGFF